MKMIDKLVLLSILKTALLTILLCTLMLVSVQLFSNIDAYVQNKTSFFIILKIALLSVPGSLVYALAPSLLFSAAFTFSQLSANNELICIYNASISQKRLVVPVLFLGIFFSLFQFVFSEFIQVPADRRLSILEADTIGLSSTKDNRNITLNDYEDGYVFYSRFYRDQTMQAQNVAVILLDDGKKVRGRIDAPLATWDEEKARWKFSDASITEISDDGTKAIVTRQEQYDSDLVDISPQTLRDNSDDIKTMSIPVANEYLRQMKKMDANQYMVYVTDYAQRLMGCLTPFVMLLIACTITYRFKRNVLLFTILMSISIAVVFYVMQMLMMILARQGVFSPFWGMAIPMIVILCLAGSERLLFLKNR